jgi:hypothetical protein
MDQATIDHREYEDLLAAAALGALTPDEHERLRRHLRTCASCRAAYTRLLTAADMLPLTVEEREPSAALRERLRAQVGAPVSVATPAAIAPPPSEPDIVPLRQEPPPVVVVPRPRRVAAGWLMIAAAMLLIGLVAGALIGRSLLAGGDEPAERQIAMESPTGMALDDATLMWMPEERVLRFSAPDMPAPPAGHVYQVWLIGGDDQPPTPVGTVDPATGEFATTVDRDRYGTFAVTVEPGPLGSPEPTTDPVIVAPLG